MFGCGLGRHRARVIEFKRTFMVWNRGHVLARS
jgi:hypothetical protein